MNSEEIIEYRKTVQFITCLDIENDELVSVEYETTDEEYDAKIISILAESKNEIMERRRVKILRVSILLTQAVLDWEKKGNKVPIC